MRTYLPREAILLIPSVTIRFLIERKFRVETQNEADFKRNEHNDEDDVPLPPQRKLPSSPCYRRTSDERIKTEMSPLPKTLSHVERYVFFFRKLFFPTNEPSKHTHTHTHTESRTESDN